MTKARLDELLGLLIRAGDIAAADLAEHNPLRARVADAVEAAGEEWIERKQANRTPAPEVA